MPTTASFTVSAGASAAVVESVTAPTRRRRRLAATAVTVVHVVVYMTGTTTQPAHVRLALLEASSMPLHAGATSNVYAYRPPTAGAQVTEVERDAAGGTIDSGTPVSVTQTDSQEVGFLVDMGVPTSGVGLANFKVDSGIADVT